MIITGLYTIICLVYLGSYMVTLQIQKDIILRW